MPLNEMNVSMDRLRSLLERARRIRETEGTPALLRHTLSLASESLFEYRSLWLYAEPVDAHQEYDEAEFLPRVDNLRFEVVRSNRQADELEAQGFAFRSCARNTPERLDGGAVALCTFVGKDLASICWVALTQEAMDALPEPPFKVDFDNGEACGADAWTNPRYRRRGLAAHRTLKTHQFYQQNGVTIGRTAYRKDTVYPERLAARFNRTRHGEARYLRVLWWRFWWERPLTRQQGTEWREQTD
ncbi:MAG: hypothetical protein SVP26_05550 [Chloroflexota bacterium]|nr:hypothetical protein [Chloroflexota bacterium]